MPKGSVGDVSPGSGLECPDRPHNSLQDADRRLRPGVECETTTTIIASEPSFRLHWSRARTAKMKILVYCGRLRPGG